ncbi:hypothetical protein TNIN_12121 [Trichonephila inaurata madagascariensis]|uniref:Uncharacterized protein n=1 Tax=Trichonephila inaurata madagascariensis TaxID=2747483 RepID=A0A8X6Y556_9ARAC|nr:hypothetical protein TNIN_12121 [Trichonephila inaurata madagascariensis]
MHTNSNTFNTISNTVNNYPNIWVYPLQELKHICTTELNAAVLQRFLKYSQTMINSSNSSSQISCFPNRSPSLNKVATASALCAEASHMGVLISFQIHHNPAFQQLISDSKPTVSLLKLQLELIYHQTVH